MHCMMNYPGTVNGQVLFSMNVYLCVRASFRIQVDMINEDSA